MRNDGLSRSLVGTFLAFVMLLSIGAAVVHAQDATPESDALPIKLIFVNAMTALDKVDVYLNGDESEQRIVEGLDYGTTSDEIEGTAPGSVVVVKQNVNWGVDRDIFNTMIPTQAGHTYVVVISDFFVIPVELDLSNPLIGDARSIGVHAAAEAPPVDVYATEASRRIPVGNLVPLLEDLQYGYSTAGGPVRTGTFDLRLMEAGTDTVVLEQDGITIESDTSYVFVIIGKPGSREQPLTVLSVSRPTTS
jgi:Domain of unknown function (DUF4397)